MGFKIEEYSFGRMAVDGTTFSKDLIVLPVGKVLSPWWRASGHRLTLDDLGPVVEARPEILVIGTGAYGIMKPEPGLTESLAELGIQTRIFKTKKAVAEYNALHTGGKKIAACFHLTC